MSKMRSFYQIFRECLRINRQYSKKTNVSRIVKLTGIALYSGSVTALSNSTDKCEDNNVVSNVYGAVRFFRSLKIGLWISVDYYFSMLGLNESSSNYKFMMSRIHQRAANNILEGCLLNGGSYIKLGQGLVAMSHILPKEYVETLKTLHDKCLMREDDEVKKIFKQDFGQEPLDIFESFDCAPIAAASIAQVYKAKTKDNQIVAVKVQYADLQSRFNSDVTTIKSLLTIAAIMHPNFNFAWIVEELESTLKQELDFINEGKNAEKCFKDLKHLKYIYVPKVYWHYTSSRVLVTEFIEGYKINECELLKNNGFSLVDINKKLFEAFGHQIFQTGFVHADPHPGNILIRKRKGQTELVLLDHGLYQQVSEDERIALSHLWKAIVLNDQTNMKKYSSQLGVQDYELFAEILTQAPLKLHGFKLTTKLSDEDLKLMTEFAKNKFDNIMCCLQDMPRTLLLVIRNLNTIRAISHDHGNPIDRYNLLARTATKTVYNNQSSMRKFLSLPSRLYFELVLNLKKLTSWMRILTYNLMHKLGVVPDLDETIAKLNICI